MRLRVTRQTMVAAGIGLAVGAAIILGIRFVTYRPERIHYHANFNVYIDGQRQAFKGPMYYEEEGGSSCAADTAITPSGRAHMHDNISDVVHVEDEAVTWGQFFQALGWTVNDQLIQTRDKVYLADSLHRVHFILNDRDYQDISNEIIGDKDRLLVDFGDTGAAALQKEFESVPATAARYDTDKDPAACMSNATPGMRERMRHLL